MQQTVEGGGGCYHGDVPAWMGLAGGGGDVTHLQAAPEL